jgi:hypothetical protein
MKFVVCTVVWRVETIVLVIVLAGIVVYNVCTMVEAGWVEIAVVTNVLAGWTDV